jgi:predicted PurR-regulated permease PerM
MDQQTQRTRIDIAPATIVKVIAAVAIVWVWLHVWQLFMLLLVAIVVAVGLDPIVCWLERRRWSRALAAAGVVALLTLLIIGFFVITGASLAGQARQLGGRMGDVRSRIEQKAPAILKPAIESSVQGSGDQAPAYVVKAGRLIMAGLFAAVLILILTLYLLIEGERTLRWVIAYAPPEKRDRVYATAIEARKAIYAYIVGNVVTSIFAAVVVLVALTLLHVPAALLLAVLAGVFDFVPVLGFICSALPAVLLALTKSVGIGLAVAAIYAAYHTAENYYIGPRVYGDRLKLSNLAVILAFAIGAAIGGVGGALLALPLAALYPVVERIWLKEYLSRGTVETHQQLERDSAH